MKVFKGRVAKIHNGAFTFFDYDKKGFSMIALELKSGIRVGDYIEFTASFYSKNIQIAVHKPSRINRQEAEFCGSLF